jgi:hypothetical protein
MLKHGAKTVQTRGGKLVGEHEKVIAQRAHEGHAHEDKVGQRLFVSIHSKHLISFGFLPTNISQAHDTVNRKTDVGNYLTVFARCDTLTERIAPWREELR